MNYIMGFDLSEALKTADRVYLCGDLKRQQDLKWIHDTGIEIGVSHYKDFCLLYTSYEGYFQVFVHTVSPVH